VTNIIAERQMRIKTKKCVLEILDALYNRAGFDDWWDNIGEELNDEITKEIEEIVRRRLEKNEQPE
jgi:hypothetical protein